MSYKERLLNLNLFPLVYDRKIKDHGFYNLNVLDFVSFVNHTRTLPVLALQHNCSSLELYLYINITW